MFRFDRSVCILLAIWNVLWIGMLVATPSIAKAEPDWRLGRAQAVAEAVFPHAQCGSDTLAQWTDPTTQPSVSVTTTGGWIVPGEGCIVHLNPRIPLMHTWYVLCTTMIHEYGHLAGLEHSTNPNSVMYWQPGYDARCDHRGRTYLDSHHA